MEASLAGPGPSVEFLQSPEYLCYFYHRYLDFRACEVQALSGLYAQTTSADADNLSMAEDKRPSHSLTWRLPEGAGSMSPVWFVSLPSDRVAERVASRSLLVKVSRLTAYRVWCRFGGAA